VARQVAAELGGTRISVTPNGIDHEVFRPEGPRGSGHYFLFAGNDKPHKNVARLVEAFSRLGRQDVRLVLAGADFARYADVEGVLAAGFIETQAELAALMRGAVAVLQPSLEEGFGLPAAEAMACGTPVITSTARSLVEVTGDGALHVDASDTEALARAMQRVLDEETLRVTLARAGVERARELTWRRCAELTRAAYRAAQHFP
jgi:glycosyltransferase involved in cell wall biosynthesis